MVRSTLSLRFLPLQSGLKVLPRTKHPSGEPQQASLALLVRSGCWEIGVARVKKAWMRFVGHANPKEGAGTAARRIPTYI